MSHLSDTLAVNLITLCRSILILGPNKRVERVWLRELALMLERGNDDEIRGYSVNKLRTYLRKCSLDPAFLTFSEVNKRTRLKPYAFIVIDEWHRFHPKKAHLLSSLKSGPLGNHTYFVSATPLNPVMEQERESDIEPALHDDAVTIKECRDRALGTISLLTDIVVGDEVKALPYKQAIRKMKVKWLHKRVGWVAPAAGADVNGPEPSESELAFFLKSGKTDDKKWKSTEAAWAIGLVRTRYDKPSKKFYLSSKGRKTVFSFPYATPYVVKPSGKVEAESWLSGHGRVQRFLKLLEHCGVLKAANGKYVLTNKKALIFCVHQGVASGLHRVLERVIENGSKPNIVCDVREDISEDLQRGFMQQAKAPYIMIATDRLSESIDLHGDCRLLVHYELPWSPLRLLQRVGRLTRMDANRKFMGAETEVHHVIIPGSVEEERVNRLVRRTELLHNEGAWPDELYGDDKEDWYQVAKAIIGAGPSMHLHEYDQ
ncbi:MAG: hypothetical protein KGL63_00935 [Betaproteobacteria bacterium]|nr:hypothetical protein [Betaproteobacteria bacterium]